MRINWDHINPNERFNFDREDGSSRYGPYDFDSVMQYGQFAFSIDGEPTITVLPPNEEWQSLIGQREHLSRLDKMIMSFLYAFPNWRFVGYYSYDCGLYPVGSFFCPYGAFPTGVTVTPDGGTLWISPGVYYARGTYNRPMTWQAPLGDVTLN